MSTASDAAGVLDDLVNQFSDPMSFLRELIQNAIDAGSGEVEIRVEHDEARQMMTVHLDDFGEGMSREIIETKLTRLFSSGKDDDFTKIGRFGIGFVSVFAISPQIVCVDTGRAGEYWRVLFKEDRTFDLLALAHPVEGTQIRIFKPATRAEYEAFTRRARAVVTYWCRHVAVPISLDGARLNQPFTLDSPCQVSYTEEGTRLVAGWVEPGKDRGGFFNRGLTLKDDEPSEWPFVAFKIDSRYLEHTLTRDQVLKDGHYQKAHALLDRVVRQDLVRALCDRLEECASAKTSEALAMWGECLGMMTRWLMSWGDVSVIERRAVIPTMYGEPLTVKELRRLHARGEVMVARGRTPLTDALQEKLVLIEVPGGRRAELLDFYTLLCKGPALWSEAMWEMPVLDARDRAPGASALKDEVRLALGALGARVEHVHFITVLGATHRARGRGEAVVRCPEELGEPVRREEGARMTRDLLLKARRVALVQGYELWPHAMALARKEPEWAALLVVKALLLQDDLGMSGKDEGVVTSHMVARRRARQEKEARHND